MKDYSGLKFNSLTAIKFAFIKGGCQHWLFVCNCGKKKVISTTTVVAGATKSCGCTRFKKGLDNPILINLLCKKFGMLTVVKFHSSGKSGTKWELLCDCGKTVVRLASNFKKKQHRHSCGCQPTNPGKKDAGFRRLFNDYRTSSANRGHSFRLGKKYFKYLVSNNCNYCGVKPSKRYEKQVVHTLLANGIDRIDSNKGYVKGNCVSCCKICNRAKNNLSRTDFHAWIKKIYYYNK